MKLVIATLLLAVALVSPSMAADLKAELVALEKTSWNAWANHDVKTFTDGMTEDAVQLYWGGSVLRGREKIAAEIGSHRCTMKSFDFSDTNIRPLSPDIAILTYIATQDVTCEGEKLPAKLFATAIYVRQGGKWRWNHYQETAVE